MCIDGVVMNGHWGAYRFEIPDRRMEREGVATNRVPKLARNRLEMVLTFHISDCMFFGESEMSSNWENRRRSKDVCHF